MKLQMLKRALIAYVTNSAKAIWSALAYPLSILGCRNGNVKSYRIYGNSVREGTPTYDAPIEVQSVGEYDEETGKYKVPIMISTENLIDVSKASSTTTRYGERGIKQTRVPETNGGGRFSVSIKAGTTIYFSFKFVEAGGGASNSALLRAYPADGGDRFGVFGKFGLVEGQRYIYSYTATKDIKQVEFYTQSSWEAGSYYILDDVKLTTEEPQTVNIYLDAPLRSMSYAGKKCVEYIDSVENAVIKYCYQEVYNGTESWELRDASYPNTFSKRITRARQVVCSHYKTATSNYVDNAIAAFNSIRVFITDPRFSTVDEFKAFLAQQAEAGTPVTALFLNYEAYEGKPTTKSIELPALPQFKGTTVYEAQTEIPPSGIEVQYF